MLSPYIPLVFKQLFRVTYIWPLTCWPLLLGFSGKRHLCKRCYVQIFSSLFIFARTKSNFFCSHNYCFYFKQISCSPCNWSHSVLYRNDGQKSEKFIPLKKYHPEKWRGKIFLILKIFISLLIQRAENISSQTWPPTIWLY